MRLIPCPACARHIRVDADACPFCEARPTPAGSSLGASAMKVGALLLGAVAMTACPRARTIYGGPPRTEDPPVEPDWSTTDGSSDPLHPTEPVAPPEPSEPTEPGPTEPAEPAPDADAE